MDCFYFLTTSLNNHRVEKEALQSLKRYVRQQDTKALLFSMLLISLRDKVINIDFFRKYYIPIHLKKTEVIPLHYCLILNSSFSGYFLPFRGILRRPIRIHHDFDTFNVGKSPCDGQCIY